MRKILLIIPFAVMIMLSFFLVSPGPGKALQVTATPTWDIKTPPYTPVNNPDPDSLFPTATQSMGFACPTGVPAGYGTVTPGLSWMMNCGSCLPTETGYPTLNWADVEATNSYNGTPQPTQTLIPITTPTIAPTVQYSNDLTCGSGMVNCTNVETGHIQYDLDSSYVYDYHVFHSWNYDGTEPLRVVLNTSQDGYIYGVVPGNIQHDVGYVTMNDEVLPDQYYSSNEFGDRFRNVPVMEFETLTLTDGGFSLCMTDGNGGLCDSQWGGVVVVAGGWTVDVYSPLHNSYPTPTPTPSITNYCSSIDDGEVDYQDYFSIIGTIRSKACFFTPYLSAAEFFNSGFIAYFSFIFPDGLVDFIASAVVPAQTICFYGFGFEVINLFGIMLDPTIFADLGIILYIIYHFTTK